MIKIKDYEDIDFDNYYNLNCDIISEKEYFSMETPFSRESSFSFRCEQQKANRPMKVAYDDEKFVGWCDVFENDEKFNPKLGIGINKNYRGMGIGKQLLQAILDECKKNKYVKIYLSAFKLNLRAIYLYTKLGFIHVESGDTAELHNGVMKESIIMCYKFKY